MIEDAPEGSESRQVFRNALDVVEARRAGQECHRPLARAAAQNFARKKSKKSFGKRKWGDYYDDDDDDDAEGSWEEPSPLVRACKEGRFAQVQSWLDGCEGRELAAKLAAAHK